MSPQGENIVTGVLSGQRSQDMLNVICQKWALLVMVALHQRTCRHGELARAVHGISPKALSRVLRDLVRLRLVDRRDYGELPPKVEYALTTAGKSLAAVLEPLVIWVGSDPAEQPSPHAPAPGDCRLDDPNGHPRAATSPRG